MGDRIVDEFDQMDLEILDLLCPPLEFVEGELVCLMKSIKVPQYMESERSHKKFVKYITLPIGTIAEYIEPSRTLKGFDKVRFIDLCSPYQIYSERDYRYGRDGLIMNVFSRHLGKNKVS